MHDLNTINRLNAVAHEKAIADWRNEGKYVVTQYEGLTLVTAEPYATLGAAQHRARHLSNPLTATHANVLPPFPVSQRVGKGRDQSEDRGVSFATVGDLLAHQGRV